MTYPDDGKPPTLYSTFSHLATRSVVAAVDEASGRAQTLMLGASENIVLNAADSVRVQVKAGGSFSLHNAVGTQDITFLNVFYNPATDEVTIRTGQRDLFLDAPTVHLNDLQVHGHFTIDGGIIGNNLNVVKYTHSNDYFCTGYGFRINERDELELVKYAMFDNGSNVNQSSVFKKVAIFGNGGAFRRDDANSNNNNELPFNTVPGASGTSLPSVPTIGYTPVPSSNPTPTPAPVVIPSPWVFSPNAKTLTLLDPTVKVGINVSNPTAALHVNGGIITTTLNATNVTTNDFTMVSDRRMKHDIHSVDDLDECLEKIIGLQLVRFKYNHGNTERERLGFIAQDVEAVAQDAVVTCHTENLSDCKTIDMNVLLAYVIGAVQRLAQQHP